MSDPVNASHAVLLTLLDQIEDLLKDVRTAIVRQEAKDGDGARG